MARQITTKEMYTDVNGNLIAQYYDPSIDDFVPFAEQSAVRILDKDGNPISSDNGLPVQLTGSSVKQKYVTIADAVAITDTAMHSFNLIDHGGLSEEEIRQFKNFKISIVNSHDQRARIDLFTAIKPLGVTTASSLTRIYQEANAVPADPGRFILQSSDIGEEGSVDTIKTVPALRNIHSNLIISISFSTAPTSGSMTIGVEMHG